MLAKTDRIYRRTEAGLKALQNPKSGLPAAYRRILGLIEGETHSDAVRGGMCPCSNRQVFDWLDEIETLGFAELASFTSSPGPDTTGNFSMLAQLARQKAAATIS